MSQGKSAQAEAVTLTERIVGEIADREGVTPLELTPPLYSAIDVDALEALFTDEMSGEERSSLVRVEFSYHGYLVTVEGAGTITIKSP